MSQYEDWTIGQKLTSIIGIAIALGLSMIVFFYTQQQEKNILLQNERTVHQVLDSISEGLQTVMITGSADVAEVFAERLKGVRDVESFRIMRTNGLEAFKDNLTINNVNTRRGEESFIPREKEENILVLPPDDPNLQRVLAVQQIVYYYHNPSGQDLLTFLLPIKSDKKCLKCHGKDEKGIRGVLEFTTSLRSVQDTVRESRLKSLLVLALALFGTLMVTTVVLRRYVVTPIEIVSRAMDKVSQGDLSQEVPVMGKDELSTMARRFNRLTSNLRTSYEGFQTEHNKLQTIIMSTHEGIVATNSEGKIVLINASAERLLEKSTDTIAQGGVLNLLDEPDRMERWLEQSVRDSTIKPELVLYKQRFLALYAAIINDADGFPIGLTVVLRDMTEEKRMERMLRELSNTDALTGLANRRCLDETLNKEFELAQAQDRDLSILMFDVDHFKKFNDTYGHDQGDRVLKAFAAKTRELVRDMLDTVCRYGGEEFMVIARDTSQEGGLRLAERIRAGIEDMAVDGLKVTTSIGVAAFRETRPASPKELAELADAALYRAKEAGRNRVMGADRSAAS
jgi:diguanylate cyclase (GGDEF)-like protein/PAS domain S-box-containing protein